ncbi:MAG: hypothetical protein BIFFINMI_00591 [Phycisphaerae bacterium]|nr:hypothetical protein [Phycisphaerae bacterium]
MNNGKKCHKLKSLSVVGGFLDGLEIDLAEGLNCLIGPRGAGKTTALEYVRHALDSSAGKQAAGVQKRLDSLVTDNLGAGRIRLRIETRDGIEYVVDRTAGGAAIVMDASGSPSEVTLANGGVFRADIYSQNDIEGIADDPGSQLSLIDNFVPDDVQRVNAAIRKVEARLSANGGKIIDVRKALDSVGDELSTLPGIQDKLKALAARNGDGSASLNQAHKLNSMRDRERRAATAADEALNAFAGSLDGLVGGIAKRVSAAFSSEMLAGPNGHLLQQIRDELAACSGDVDRLIEDARNRIVRAQDRLAEIGGELATSQAEQELAFREQLARHDQAKGQEAERIRLETLRNQLLEKKRVRDEHTESLQRLQKERAELLGQLSSLRDERFAFRRKVAARITDRLAPRIRVSVAQFGDPSRYRELLLEALAGAGVNRNIVAQKVADNLSPGELAAMVAAGDTKSMIERATLNPNQASNVVAAFAGPKMMFRLETIELDDKPRIELLDGEEYKDSTSLSTGQKCTTILPILLLDSDNPLLIDQPEDNLDNGFIYDTVVDCIRKAKGRRQMLFVTHNPNIPVLGDAERVFVLRSNGARAVKAREGTVDECREEIIGLLEGGQEAFMKRKERYRI